jgi:hypothetical protein
MSELVSEDDLARARNDPAFRQQMLAEHLERLLGALNKMRQDNSDAPETAAQMREGVDLAVELADRLQRQSGKPGPKAA